MTSVSLSFQEPGAPGGNLLEALISACDGAQRGGAAFAFATVDGVRLFLGNPIFRSFLAESEGFDLIVGIDAITNGASLDAISAIDTPTFRPRAFFHSRQPLLFHPKVAWFRHQRSMTLIIGSGNLTPGGLRSNWEAFSSVTVGRRDAQRLEREIEEWLDRSSAKLLALDDPRVRERAGRNKGRERDLQVPAPDEQGQELEREEAQSYEAGNPVLVAELSRSGDRPSQANFHLAHYEGYFGALRGSRRTIALRLVNADGTFGDAESKPSVEAKSKNYRFELGTAFAGRAYPEGGRPIGLFVRTEGSIFLYQVLFPNEAGHAELTAFLDRKQALGDSMRQERATIDELSTAWPETPVLRAEPPS
jgi:hypothetical protein